MPRLPRAQRGGRVEASLPSITRCIGNIAGQVVEREVLPPPVRAPLNQIAALLVRKRTCPRSGH